MIQLERLTTPEEYYWFKERTYVPLSEDMQGVVAYRGNRILGACIINDFYGTTGVFHGAVDNPIILRHGFIEKIAELAFLENKLERLFTRVPSSNERALKFDKHVGFEEVAVIPKGFTEDVDCVVLVLTRDAAQQWLPNKKEAA